jgi:serine/threonine-protein kinase
MSRGSLINTVIGEYRLVDFLGAGGMGEVYRGVHSKIGRVVAIKLMTQAVRNPTFVDRFLNEARIQATLNHPNIATLYDFLDFNGQPCIVMEYIEGQELDDRIRAYGGLPLPEALRIFQATVEAIEYVHRQGIVHRDIKSNNIKLSNTGQVKLLDFGIAKGGSTPQLTVTGAFIGTLQYLSPEQITGGVADARSDIWALGVLLFEMITGQLPFQATTLGELCEKIVKTSHAPPTSFNAGVPREVEAIISRCLKKKAQDRYQTATDLLQDVRRAAGQLSQPAQVSGPHQVRHISAPHEVHRPSGPQTMPQVQPAQQKPAVEKPKSNVAMISIAAAVFLLVMAGVIYLIIGTDTSVSGTTGTQQSTQNKNSNPNAPVRTIKIDAVGGQAEVFMNNERVGNTPYKFEGRVKEQFDFTLKRNGFKDRQVHISVTDTGNEYMYMLEKQQ